MSATQIRAGVALTIAVAVLGSSAPLVTPNALAAVPSTAAPYDVIVYGATAAGVLAALAAAGEGAETLLLEPRSAANIGGMVTGGLSATDIGTTTAVLGGRTRAFFEAVGHAYGSNASVYEFEPHVASDIFGAWLAAAAPRLTVVIGARLVSAGLSSEGSGGPRRWDNATDAAGRSFAGRVWIDATYEGLSLPLVGASFAWGREGGAAFNESVAGVTQPCGAVSPGHNYTCQPQVLAGVGALWANGSAISGVTPPPGAPWTGDNRTQAYNFRVTLTNNASNAAPFPRPAAYDAADYEFVRRYIALHGLNSTHGLVGGTALPGAKFDDNSQLTDWVGESWAYVAAVAATDAAGAAAVWARHETLAQGYFWFLANDPGLPAGVREGMRGWGLPADEFSETGHWPPQLYVREALRLQGDWVLTQADREVDVTKADSVAMGAYSIDIIPVSQAADDAGGSILREGGIQAPSFLPPSLSPFQIPYRALLPKRAELSNLLVPVALSSSHVGFCAVRLEPTWMPLGESAGVAAAMAVRGGVAVQDVPGAALQARLRQLGQVLEL